jgi:hypothetical protein
MWLHFSILKNITQKSAKVKRSQRFSDEQPEDLVLASRQSSELLAPPLRFQVKIKLSSFSLKRGYPDEKPNPHPKEEYKGTDTGIFNGSSAADVPVAPVCSTDAIGSKITAT